nr:hypothetical protein [Vibrio splendidus]
MEQLACTSCHQVIGFATDSAPKGFLFCVDCGEAELAKDESDE